MFDDTGLMIGILLLPSIGIGQKISIGRVGSNLLIHFSTTKLGLASVSKMSNYSFNKTAWKWNMMGPFTAIVRWDFILIGPILLNIQIQGLYFTDFIQLYWNRYFNLKYPMTSKTTRLYIHESTKANSSALFMCTAWFNYNHSSLSKCKQFVYKHDTTCWHFMLQGQQDVMPRTNVSFTTLSWEQT